MIKATKSFVKERPWVSAFTLAYYLAFVALTILRGNQEFVFYALTMLPMFALVLIAHARVGFSTLTLWGLSFWGLFHMAGGNVPVGEERGGVLYNLWLIGDWVKYDNFVHAFGFFFASLAMWEGVRAATRYAGEVGLGLAIAIAAMGMGLGATNEVIEYAATLLVPETNVGGYVNTARDMVWNMIGSALAAALVVVRSRQSESALQPSG